MHCFELALLEDPNYPLAWSGLADAYTMLGFYDFLPYRDALAKAKTAAEKAVALDSSSAEAHCSLAFVLGWYLWDVHGAERHFLKALELNTNYAVAHYWYSTVLMAMGREEESIAQNQRALACDPLSKSAHAVSGWMLLTPHRFVEALAPLVRSVELDPDFPTSRRLLGWAYWLEGKTEAALVEFQQAVELSRRLPMLLSTLGWALALSGEVAQAQEILRELQERTTPAPSRPLYLANVHAALGENDQAFTALEQALVERDYFLQWLPVRCGLIELLSLESDPRWPAFLEKVIAAMQASSGAEIPFGPQSFASQ
jgi:tetratricopeptide (TPR) repeat protein